MNGSKKKPMFWGAIIAQVVGAQVFFWDALPDYQELTAGAVVVGMPRDFAVAVLGICSDAISLLVRLPVFSPKSGLSSRQTGSCPALC